MHQAHAKTAQFKTGSSLCSKIDGFRASYPLDKVFGIFFADMFYQGTVLIEDRFQHILKKELIILCAAFRCRVLFQSDLLNLDV
jgi:hypothetical protein